MRYGELITKDYPIVLTKPNPIDPSIEEVDEYFEHMENFLDSTQGPYVFISHKEKASFISSESRTHIGNQAIRIATKYGTRCKGSIIVANGVIATLMIKAIATVYTPLKNMLVVSTIDEAYAKAKELLEKSI